MSIKPIGKLKGVITQEVVHKAFTKTKTDQRFAVEGCRLELVKESRYEDIMAFYRENYIPDEPVAKSLDLQWDKDMQGMIMNILKQNLSTAFTSSENGNIIGALGVIIANKHEKINTDQYNSEALRIYMNVGYHFDNMKSIYDHFKVEDIVYFNHLAVSKDLRQKGIGTTLVRAAMAFVENFDIGLVALRVEGSSNFSKRILEKLGFQVLAEILYADYKVDGKVVIANYGQHNSQRLYGMIVG